MDKLREKIKNYVSNPPKNYEIQYINKNYNIRNLYNIYKNNSQNLYHFYYEIKEIPKCICGKELRFISFNRGYTHYCSSKCQMSDNNFKNKMKNYYLNKYSVENPAQSIDIQQKIKKTNLERYGVENFLQLKDVHKKAKQTKLEKYENENYNNSNKRKQTNLEKYGVEFVCQNKDISKKQQISKLKNHQLNMYKKLINKFNNIIPLFNSDQYNGVNYINKYDWKCNKCGKEFKDDLYAGRTPRCPYCYPMIGGISKQEKQLLEYIKALNIKCITNTRLIIKPYEIDIYLPDYKLAIEYNGLYYHSIKKVNDKYYHQNKIKLAHEKGIRLLHIWEHEWLEKRESVKNIIQYYINNLNEEIKPEEPKLYNIHGNLIWI